MHTQRSSATHNLASQYARSEGSVAFVDESYSTPRQRPEGSFYIVTGVVIELHRLMEFRNHLQEIADSDFWHTTDLARNQAGRDLIERMTCLVAESATIIHWIHRPIEASDKEGERARVKTFKQALVDLASQDLPERGLVVYEKRRDDFQLRADERVIHELRSRGQISRDFLIQPASPAIESALWAADTLAWGFRQLTQGSSSKYFELQQHVAQIRIVK